MRLAAAFRVVLLMTVYATPFWVSFPLVGEFVEKSVRPILVTEDVDFITRGENMAAARWKFRKLSPAEFSGFEAVIITDDGVVIDISPLECTASPRFFRSDKSPVVSPDSTHSRVLCFDTERAQIHSSVGFTVRMGMRFRVGHNLWPMRYKLPDVYVPPLRLHDH